VRPEPDRLRAIPLFADLSEEELGTLASLFTVEDVGDSRRLTPEAASGYTFYVIASGTVDVVRSDERIAQLGAGDYFGEMTLMGDGRRVADVIATSPMVVFAMFRTAFREMEAAFPEIASKVRATLEERLPAS
jgi:CRP-like cAMP-binding protein